jgi:hypothetical protein
MNVEIGTEAAQFPEKEYIKIFVAVWSSSMHLSWSSYLDLYMAFLLAPVLVFLPVSILVSCSSWVLRMVCGMGAISRSEVMSSMPDRAVIQKMSPNLESPWPFCKDRAILVVSVRWVPGLICICIRTGIFFFLISL